MAEEGKILFACSVVMCFIEAACDCEGVGTLLLEAFQSSSPAQRLLLLSQLGDPGRLTTSLAESICVRASIKPATFPFKVGIAVRVYN